MLGPGAHADPAKVKLALAARDVVAALVLLDAGLAGRTLLGIDQNPVCRLALVAALERPHA